MKKISAVIILLFVGMTVAHAGGFMLLHVGDANGNGGGGSSCGTGVINLSTGCTQPMFGGL